MKNALQQMTTQQIIENDDYFLSYNFVIENLVQPSKEPYALASPDSKTYYAQIAQDRIMNEVYNFDKKPSLGRLHANFNVIYCKFMQENKLL